MGENIDFVPAPAVELRPPLNPSEWRRYFDLRWRVLRAPWDQPRGSEQDGRENDSSHLAVWTAAGQPLAVGRIQLNSPTEAQVRYMAVEPGSEGVGLGGRILAGLETIARDLGAIRVVLNAREGAQRFYERHGYTVLRPAETMFGTIAHVHMYKDIVALDNTHGK